ncbi:uncharacterized protein G2W53_013799 [Senna tora]|uniref:Uncharacterized protein n=1 Tax=Senna tora TaxID=362788 RepID=A0A834U235_9FABA|nr:uncharacterized protein G2W53_013799 [Senna tora]
MDERRHRVYEKIDWTSDSSDSYEMYVLHEIPVPEQPPEDNQNDDQEHLKALFNQTT